MNKEAKTPAILRLIPLKWLLPLIVVAVIAIAAVITWKTGFFTKSDTVKLGFEDIGELATQAAYSKEVSVIEGDRKLFGHSTPFTQSKYIYSYAVIIKAGLDFSDIDWSVEGATVTVRLPEVRILSSEIDLDSFELYLESESIFRQISIEENNEALKQLREDAETSAVVNGLLDNARSNAETILTGFFANVYDLETYTIEFTDK